MFFGTFLHNYTLMLRNGKYTSIIMDIPNWKLYYNSNAQNKELHQKYDMRKTMLPGECGALDTVFDQGSCPACFPFALANVLGTKLCTMRSNKNGTNESSESSLKMPSPYRIFDCAGSECKDSTWGVRSLNVVKAVMEGVPDVSETPPVFGWGCERGRIKTTGFNDVCGNSWIKREVFLNGPVIIAVDLKERRKELAQFNEWRELEFRFSDDQLNNDDHDPDLMMMGMSSLMLGDSTTKGKHNHTNRYHHKTLFKESKAKNHLEFKKEEEEEELLRSSSSTTPDADSTKRSNAGKRIIIEVTRHALMVIGWDEHPVPHWIVKNSWGYAWGQNGIGRVPWKERECAFTFEPLLSSG